MLVLDLRQTDQKTAKRRFHSGTCAGYRGYGKRRSEHIVRAKEAVMDNVVTKPFRIPKLIPEMNRLLRREIPWSFEVERSASTLFERYLQGQMMYSKNLLFGVGLGIEG
jgi:hypothetical protein